MRKVIGAAFVSLDGVMQGPGGPTEDPTGGFELGGWVFEYGDEAVIDSVQALFAGEFDLLLGRRTYDIFAAYWPFAEGDDNSIGRRFDRAAKYVVTRGDQPLEWQNSHRIANIDAIAELKRGEGPDLIIQGSSTLYPQLLAAGLLDRLMLMTIRIVLGSGKRLFGDGTPPLSMRMIDHKITTDGNFIATYYPVGAVEPHSFAATEPSAAERERRTRIEEGVW